MAQLAGRLRVMTKWPLPHLAQVTLQTERDTLARLAKASICTGYQLANAEVRLLLERGASAIGSASAAAERDEQRLSPTERSRLSPAAAAHIAGLEARLQRLEQRCEGDRAEQASNP